MYLYKISGGCIGVGGYNYLLSQSNVVTIRPIFLFDVSHYLCILKKEVYLMLFYVEIRTTDTISGNQLTLVHGYDATFASVDKEGKTITFTKSKNDSLSSVVNNKGGLDDFEGIVAIYNLDDVIRVWNNKYIIDSSQQKAERYQQYLTLKEEFKE